MPKVFIYEDDAEFKSTKHESIQDLVTLFSTDKIFSERPDVVKFSYLGNLTGLSRPVFVMPGGQTTGLMMRAKEVFKKIHNDLEGAPYHYVGICAGGFIGAKNAHLYIANAAITKLYESETSLPRFFTSLPTLGSTYDVISDYDAMGELYPVSQEPRKLYLAREANIRFSDGELSHQLYISGPAFIPNPSFSPLSTTEVVATYNEPTFRCYYKSEGVIEHQSPAAIIRRKATAEKGGVFLSGTHIESTVRESKLFRLFQLPTREIEPLSSEAIKSLEHAQEDLHQKVEGLLRTTFT